MTIAMMINLLSGTKKTPEDPERTNRERVNVEETVEVVNFS